MGDYLEKFYRRNMTIEELVRRASSTNGLEKLDQGQTAEPPKYITETVNHLEKSQILFLFFYLIGVIYFGADYLGLLHL